VSEKWQQEGNWRLNGLNKSDQERKNAVETKLI
jgi:hypothetical protein